MSAVSSDPLLRFRPEFPIREKTTYLIFNSLGAMSRGAAGRLREYAEITTDEELDRAFDAIDETLASRAWERWSNRPTVVT
jgi:kynureninase